MRKTINSAALIVFIWLLLDALNAPHALLYFIIAGELPGTNIILSPTIMLSILTLIIGIIVFEICARQFGGLRRLRAQLLGAPSRRQTLPSRRFNRA